MGEQYIKLRFEGIHPWPGGRVRRRGAEPRIVPSRRVRPLPGTEPEPEFRQLYELRDLLRRVDEIERVKAWMDNGGEKVDGQE